ncbi:MAG: hypothetical protein K2G67_01875 [Muribaculaceae bacterium]|nr:hypothetical protein [Muribaculaceae bacterium]
MIHKLLNYAVDNLSLHIQFLLLHHDCVVIPGVGAFINAHRSAYYDEKSGTWFPPSREIRFNGALKHDDGLLTSSYARKNKMGFEEGRELLRKDISRLLENLEMDGEVTVGNLGILRYTEDALAFNPMRTAEDWNKIIGYLPVKISLLTASCDNEIESLREDDNTVSPAQDIKRARTRVFDTRKNYYIAINKIVARSAACILVTVIILLSFIRPGIDHNFIDQANVLPVETLIREKVSPIPTQSVTVEENQKNQTRDAEGENFKSEQQSEDEHFQLIVATFTSQKEAETFVAARNGNGYELKIIPTSKRYRVSVAGSDKKDDLLSLMNSSEFQSHFPESWIWGQGKFESN